MEPAKYPHVLIIGSGITGLALAHSLKKAGVSFEIFERSSAESYESRRRDWGITVHWGSSLLHHCLPPDVLDNLRTAQVNQKVWYTDKEAVSIINTATGELIKNVPLGQAGRYSHRKLLNLLKEGIDIQYNKKIERIVECPSATGITAYFRDGSYARGDLLVGADGSHSFVRKTLLGKSVIDDLIPLDLTMNNFVAQYTEPQTRFILSKLHRFLDMGVNPDGTFFALVPIDIPDPLDLQKVKFQIFISFPGQLSEEQSTSAERLNILKAQTKGFVEPFRSAIEWLPAYQEISNDQICYLKVQSWKCHNGKVTLAGDAAHPLPPHRGQGFNNCLQDISNLTEACLKARSSQVALSEAILQYDVELIERAEAEMKISVRQSEMMHRWDDMMSSPLMTIGAQRVHREEMGAE